MDSRIVVTRVYNRICAFYMENGEASRIRVIRGASGFGIGTVVMARVKKLVSSSDACFVDIGDKTDYFLQLPKDPKLIRFGDNRSHDRVKCEDIILVQISSEAVKKKAPCVTYNPALGSAFFVISGGHGISYSGKISENDRKTLALPEIIHEISAKYHIIVRTATAAVHDTALLANDLKHLLSDYENIMNSVPYAPVKSILHSAATDLNSEIGEWFKYGPEELVTDLGDFRDELEHLAAEKKVAFRFYSDDLLPLCKLYRLESTIDKSLGKQVYLKSGGFIIIEQCETLCAIDVNSGHNTDGDKEDVSFEINLEASSEIFKQLKIRNISGMIVIDYINMKDQAHVNGLTGLIRKLSESDDVACRYVDMTGLGLIELTRKKVRMSLYEQWRA